MGKSEQKYRLVFIAEGDVEGVWEFDSAAERSAFNAGLQVGGGAYGAGSCFGVEYPEETDGNLMDLDAALLKRVKAAGKRGKR